MGIKVTRIDHAGTELLSTQVVDATYSGEDADFDGTPGQYGDDQWKQPVRCATTASVTIATALNAGDTIDGVTLAAGDRVLVKDQGTASQNGIYVAGATPERAADLDSDDEVLGAVVYVIDGTDNAGTIWGVTNDAATIVDTDAIDWAQVTGAGSGLDLSLSTVAASGATETLDASVARTHDVTLTADCTFTFTGAVTAEAWYFTLVLRQDGTGGWDATWPGSVAWPGGVAPTLDTTASTAEVLTFFTLNGGTDWFGFHAGSGGGGGTPATTVTDETTWGITPAVGSDTEYARQDHTHGTPANPVSVAALEALGVRGELVVADGTSGPQGIVPSSYVEMTTPDSTTSASLEDITGASTTITLQRTGHVAAWMTCHVSASGVCTLGLAINFDGTDHDVVDVHLTSTDEGSVTVLHRTTTELPPGTYTIKGRMQRVSGGGTPSVDRADLLVTALATTGPVLVTTDDETDYVYADLGA